MRVWNDLNDEWAKSPDSFKGGTVTIGKFDGLHLGHQRLLQRVHEGPKPSVLLTFDPHPMQVLHPERGITKIFPKADLVEQLPCYGLDLLAVIQFSTTIASQRAEEFAERCLWQPFEPKLLVVGYDFAFGQRREGNIEWLKTWCGRKKIRLTVVSPLESEGEIVSSRRVRDLLLRGEVETAERLLGRPYYVRGVVVKGAGRGRGIGFPTLNQAVENETLPALGVYATRTKIGGQVFASVTNVGRVPTFTDGSRLHVETHLIDVSKEAYGLNVDVEFLNRLRPEMKFHSVDDLKKQIQQDILSAKRELSTREKMDVHKPHQ